MNPKSLKSRIFSIFAIVLVSAGMVLLHSCGSDLSMQPKGNYISGHPIFVDTNFIHGDGYYAAALYNSSGSPFTAGPITTEKIDLNTGYPFYYRVDWDGEGSCFAAIVWIREPNPNNEPPYILGTFGCDTTHLCNTNHPIAFPNFTGADYNILCWTDTLHCLHK